MKVIIKSSLTLQGACTKNSTFVAEEKPPEYSVNDNSIYSLRQRILANTNIKILQLVDLHKRIKETTLINLSNVINLRFQQKKIKRELSLLNTYKDLGDKIYRIGIERNNKDLVKVKQRDELDKLDKDTEASIKLLKDEITAKIVQAVQQGDYDKISLLGVKQKDSANELKDNLAKAKNRVIAKYTNSTAIITEKIEVLTNEIKDLKIIRAAKARSLEAIARKIALL